MMLLTKEILKKFEKVGDQSEVSDPLIIAKFFNPCGGQTWWLSEYWPDDKIFYCYVTGMAFDEWGTISLDEIESFKGPMGLGIERDRWFDAKRFSEIKEVQANQQ